jgi:hypothetical protein
MNRWKSVAAGLLVGLSTVVVPVAAQAATSTPCQKIVDQLNDVKDRAEAVNLANFIFKGPEVVDGIQTAADIVTSSSCDDSVAGNRTAVQAALDGESDALVAQRQVLRILFADRIRANTVSLLSATEDKLPNIDLTSTIIVIQEYS